jgi:hypothetical protein
MSEFQASKNFFSGIQFSSGAMQDIIPSNLNANHYERMQCIIRQILQVFYSGLALALQPLVPGGSQTSSSPNNIVLKIFHVDNLRQITHH